MLLVLSTKCKSMSWNDDKADVKIVCIVAFGGIFGDLKNEVAELLHLLHRGEGNLHRHEAIHCDEVEGSH